MLARTHDVFAFSWLITAAVYYPPASLNIPTLFSCVVGNVVGSLLPDLDQASNRLWDLLPAGNLMGKIFRRLFLSHRTISHSLVGFFLFYKVFEFVLPKLLNPEYVNIQLVFVSIMIGLASHLVGDAVTREGIPLFFPIKWKFGFPPISALRFVTGSWFENLVVLPGIAVYIAWFVNENQQTLLKILLELKSLG
jgi:inner membrane protein